MLHFHASRHVNKRAAAENRGVQRRKFVVAGRNYLSKPSPENLRMFFQTFGRTDKDHALFADRLLDIGINRFAIELRFHAGEKFALLLWNTEALERPLYIFGNFIPRARRALTLREIVTDLIEIDRFEIFARPMRWQWFALESLQRLQSKFADPIRVLFHVGDIIHDALIETDAGVIAVINLVLKVANVAIDIDG